MSTNPYPKGCNSPSKRREHLEDTADTMGRSGDFENAHAIRQRLKKRGYGDALVDKVIPEVAEGFNFTYWLDEMCRTARARRQRRNAGE